MEIESILEFLWSSCTWFNASFIYIAVLQMHNKPSHWNFFCLALILCTLGQVCVKRVVLSYFFPHYLEWNRYHINVVNSVSACLCHSFETDDVLLYKRLIILQNYWPILRSKSALFKHKEVLFILWPLNNLYHHLFLLICRKSDIALKITTVSCCLLIHAKII